jgi:hypothetical protein
MEIDSQQPSTVPHKGKRSGLTIARGESPCWKSIQQRNLWINADLIPKLTAVGQPVWPIPPELSYPA